MSGLKDKLENDNSILSNLNGGQKPTRLFGQSEVHRTYSINSIPSLDAEPLSREEYGVGNLPAATILDGTLNGALPNSPLGASTLSSFVNGTYRASAPEGRSF
jgi:hypothetical protein